MEDKKQNVIPKVIHYFWFGKAEKPASVKKCIESWKKFCPDFEIKEWNEDNYDVHKYPYVKKAYEERKWAFVSDFARLDVLVQQGGIYLDTDVEILKNLSPLCCHRGFIGFENPGMVNDGQGFGCEPGMPIFREMLECYDSNDAFDTINGVKHYIESPKLRTRVLLKHGLVPDGSRQSIDDVEVFPVDYFCPLDYDTGLMNITENTYSIHHFDSSWHGKNAAKYNKMRQFLNRTFGVKLGKRVFENIMHTKDAVKGIFGKRHSNT